RRGCDDRLAADEGRYREAAGDCAEVRYRDQIASLTMLYTADRTSRRRARAQSVLMSVWRTCWQLGRSAIDFLSQLLRGPHPKSARFPASAWPADVAVPLDSRDRQRY